VEQTLALIEAMCTGWDPSRYEDRYTARLADVIKRKKKGGTIKAPKVEKEPAPTPDLMAALEQTLADMKSKDKAKGAKAKSGARSKSGAKKGKAKAKS
jgi:DNA end-binding protein Ku